MTGGHRLGGSATSPGPGDPQAASGGRRNAEVQRDVDESIAHQRLIIREMNLTLPEHRDRLLTDVAMVDSATGRALDRGQAFDLHALHLWVWAERALR